MSPENAEAAMFFSTVRLASEHTLAASMSSV